jgi:putative Ca2+/H+ antiporter (TMEM165/GDT1 family)
MTTTPLAAFLISLGAVALAEMGDKTQIITMTFASKYKPAKVLVAIVIAIALISAVSVAAGTLLARNDALRQWIQLIAAVSFIVFGLWSLREQKDEQEKPGKTKFGPIVTVAIAFFVAELGDKTQLATVALAAEFPQAPVLVFLGSSLGLLAANGLGIFVGAMFCRRIPDKVFRLISAGVFFLFGLYGIWEAANGAYGAGTGAIVTAGVALLTLIIAWRILTYSRAHAE